MFERIIESIVRNENLNGFFVYLGDVPICGMSEAEHEENKNSCYAKWIRNFFEKISVLIRVFCYLAIELSLIHI